MQTLLAHYKSILAALRYNVGEDDFIGVMNPLGSVTPAKSDGMRWVMPTMKRLRDGFGDDLQPFHPLSEQISRKGVSPVLQHMQRKLKAEISLVLSMVTDRLVEVTLDAESHKDIPLNISDFLKRLSNLDANTKNQYKKLMDAANKKHKLVTVYLKSGGKFKGIDVNRMTIIKFPFLEELKDESKEEPCGVNIPKKHRKVLIELFELVIPNGDLTETYSHGTNTRTAPYFVSFLHAAHKILTQLNKVLETYNGPLNIGLNQYELFDIDIVESFEKLQDVIPPLNGNEGRVSSDEELAEANSQNNNTVAAAAGMFNTVNEEAKKPKAVTNPAINQQTIQQQVTQQGSNSMDAWLSKLRGNQPQPAMAQIQVTAPNGVYQQPRQQQPFTMYQTQPQQMGYGGMMQPQQPMTNAAGHVMLPWNTPTGMNQYQQQPTGFNISSGNQNLPRL